jgi:hypothetical protein
MEIWHELKPEIIKTGKEKEAEMMEKAMQFYNPALMLKRMYGDALKVDEGIVEATEFMLGNGEGLSKQSKKILGIVVGAKDYLQAYNPYGYNGFDTEHAISALVDRGLPHELIINPEGIKRDDLKKFDKEKGKFKTVNLPMIKYDIAGEDMPTRMFTPPK